MERATPCEESNRRIISKEKNINRITINSSKKSNSIRKKLMIMGEK
jgi:hypothetical protein